MYRFVCLLSLHSWVYSGTDNTDLVEDDITLSWWLGHCARSGRCGSNFLRLKRIQIPVPSYLSYWLNHQVIEQKVGASSFSVQLCLKKTLLQSRSVKFIWPHGVDLAQGVSNRPDPDNGCLNLCVGVVSMERFTVSWLALLLPIAPQWGSQPKNLVTGSATASLTPQCWSC